MQFTFQPLQLLSRVIAAAVVALPLAALHLVVDDFERQAVAKMTHQELIAFVQEAHAGSFLGAYIHAAILVLILVAAVEAVAFAVRLAVGLFVARKPADAREDELVPARTNTFP
jgi:hypothetical protein